MTVTPFGTLPCGEQAHLYTIRGGSLEAAVTDFGATLVSLFVPDRAGNRADVVLGFDDAAAYAGSDAFLGATVGRNANRIAGASLSWAGRSAPWKRTTMATISIAEAIPTHTGFGRWRSIRKPPSA